MFFHKAADIDGILKYIRPKLEAILQNSKYGVDIEIKKHSHPRSLKQNKYLWAIYKHIVEFWESTGFIVDNLPLRFVTSDFLHEYFKNRFDHRTTTKMTTAEFMNYTDSIQNLIIEQSKGEYIFKNMRHTGSTAYVEAGVATNAIISITGHTNEAIFNQVYKGNTEEVTLPALKKRLEAESRNNKIKESE